MKHGLPASFQESDLERWARPLWDWAFKVRLEVKISGGSGIRDPQIEVLELTVRRQGIVFVS